MAKCSRFSLRVSLILLLGICFLGLPLKAQLDPQLQSSKTDFLNLYQQSTNTKVKPEVLTLFDFSGSMNALMYHPLFVNSDLADSGTAYTMDFTLTPRVAGVPANNTYTITATSRFDNSVSVSWTVLVNGTATVTQATETSNRTQTRVSGTYYNVTTTVTAKSPTSGTTGNAGTAITFKANVSFQATTGHTTFTNSSMNTYNSKVGTPDGGLNWKVTGPPNTSGTSAGTPSGTSTGSPSWNLDETFAWTVPTYQTGTTGGADPYVTARLITTNRYGGPTVYYTTTSLVRPDGQFVTYADADRASSSSGLNGAGSGSGDVRNWVRAASHVRMSSQISTTVTRTIDIPIPWKIMSSASSSTTNPIPSYTVLDTETKTAVDGTVITYGSQNSIEMDKTYSLNGGDNILDNSSTYVTLKQVTYRAAYVTWLFTGTYTHGDSSYIGKYIVYDAVTASLVGGQGAANWGQGFGAAAKGNSIIVPQFDLQGVYTGTLTSDVSTNVVPALTRVQAVKRAAISTWIAHQADVLWAYRFLDDVTEDTTTTISNNSAVTFNTSQNTGSDSAWRILNNTSSQSATSSSNNSLTGMNRIAGLFAGNSTPLTYAMANSLAQFTDPNSIFNTVETGLDAPSQCMNHFLILFTDGQDNNGGSNSNSNYLCPYYIPTGSNDTNGNPIYKISAVTGNHSIIASKASLNAFNQWWDLFSFAGVAAHLGDTTLGVASVDFLPTLSNASRSGTASTLLPYSIGYRGTGTTLTQFDKPHLITTMTVGVSLAGLVSDTASPKHSLFIAAAVGDPKVTELTSSTLLVPFIWDQTANSGNGGKVANSIYFFDATDPDKLSTSLDNAILSAIGASNINTATAPSTPYIGSALGGEMLIGKFQPPPNGGSIWTGDLLMFGTRLVNDSLEIIGKDGALASTIDSNTAQWSAQSALYNNRLWKNRILYTRLPGTSSVAEPGLSTFSDLGTPYTDSSLGLKNFVAQASNNANRASYPVGSAVQQQVIQWAMGGDLTNLDSSGRPVANRANIMGDIINSAPATLEYLYSDVSGGLTSPLSAGGTRFRLVLVGTNQGWLHAFGEVVREENAVAGNTTTPVIVKGAVDELWSFMPTDFLGYLDQVTVTSNPHRFMVDGTPVIYHLDLPPTGGGSGDNIEEVTTLPGPERAMVLFGLGKGGRSYYALDIHNPYSPVLRWSLVPSEASLVTTSRILSRPGAPDLLTVQNVIKKMGFSSCTPGIGRITLTDSTGKAVVRDAVFFGGGFSIPEVEVNFPDASGKPTPLGRSVLALDAYSGKILAAVDLSASTTTDGNSKVLTPGPISKGVVPFEFILNSGMAQRAYFLDFWGGLWSWGNQKTDTVATLATLQPNPTYQYRMDSSDLSTWTTDGSSSSPAGIRLVAKDMNGTLMSLTNYSTTQQYYSEALYSTLPAPFRVGTFPGQAKVPTSPVPAAVGIAIESGDRNNPLDYNYTTASKPVHHRLSVVFDRQDSLAWGTVANPIIISPTSSAVMNAYRAGVTSYQFGDSTITPGQPDYYLAPDSPSGTKFGYYRNFPDIDNSTGLIPKGINTPAVISGSLFYSYFTPTKADPCKGGTGNTYTSLISDVMNPIVADNRTDVSGRSGLTGFTFVGVASDFIALGTRGAIQIGTLAVDNPAVGASQTTLAAETIHGRSTVKYPKARVWRTVH